MKSLKSPKTTKRLATLSAAFLVGSVATFGADVDVGTNAETGTNAVSNKTGANDVKKSTQIPPSNALRNSAERSNATKPGASFRWNSKPKARPPPT